MDVKERIEERVAASRWNHLSCRTKSVSEIAVKISQVQHLIE